MSEQLEPMDWATYFASLTDECLQVIADHLHRERMQRELKRYKETLSPINEEEMALVNNGQYIQAVKDYKNRNKVGLREAKFAVDQYRGFVHGP